MASKQDSERLLRLPSCDTVENVRKYVAERARTPWNVPGTRYETREAYSARKRELDPLEYDRCASLHYFMARVLFLKSVWAYADFAGHQCVENYLKGFFAAQSEEPPPDTHRLLLLCERCKEVCGEVVPFLASDECRVVLQQFEPFYEISRYPVGRVLPDGPYVRFIADDVVLLDYFVYEMRSASSPPWSSWKEFQARHPDLYQVEWLAPDLIELFVGRNINFTG